MSDQPQEVTIASITVYPVKGCRGCAAEAAVLEPAGLALDRAWMVVSADDPVGRFITQRQEPRMCLIEASLPPGALEGRAGGAAGGALELRAPGVAAPLAVPLAPPPAGAPTRRVRCWGWQGLAVDCGDAAADWLSAFLGQPVRLVRHGAERRAVDWHGCEAHAVRFADQQPLLLASAASLAALNAALDAAGQQPAACGSRGLGMERFRPNIVLAGKGLQPWAEEGWAALEARGGGAGGLALRVTKPCARCRVPTVDPARGEFDAAGQPLAFLRERRSGEALGWTAPPSFRREGFFGVQAVVERGPGAVLRVGDALVVAARRVEGGAQWALE